MTIRFLAPQCAAYDTALIENDQTMMQQFFASGSMAIDTGGQPVYVLDRGAMASPRYTWERIVEDATQDGQIARWRNGHWQAEGLSGIATSQEYPWLVLTRTDDPAEVVTAIAEFVADNAVDQDAHPWGVDPKSGRRSGLDFTEYLERLPSDVRSGGFQQITSVWPVGGPAPWWWSLIPTGGNSPDTWWATYFVGTDEPVAVRMGWRNDQAFVEADFEAVGLSDAAVMPAVPQDVLSNAVPARTAYLGLWVPETLGHFTSAADLFISFQEFDAAPRLEIGGVPGRWMASRFRIRTRHAGTTLVINSIRSQTEYPQPHPNVVSNVVRIGGNTYDAASQQIVGPRPQNQADRQTGNLSWATLALQQTPPLEGIAVEPGS